MTGPFVVRIYKRLYRRKWLQMAAKQKYALKIVRLVHIIIMESDMLSK